MILNIINRGDIDILKIKIHGKIFIKLFHIHFNSLIYLFNFLLLLLLSENVKLIDFK